MLLGFVSLAVTTRGALLGALPPLLAVSLVALLDRSAARSSHDDRMASVAVYAVTAIAFGLAWLVARDVLRDAPEPSVWLGGRASSGTPPTFDSVIEQVFHAFAPWSALLPVAIGQLWLRTARVREEVGDGDDAEPAEAPLGLCALLWAAFGYGAQTLYLSRYGREVTFLPIVALSLLVALFLRDVERRGNGSWAAGISALFLTCLVLRDYAMYPSVPLHGMPIANFEVPKVWNPTGAWALTLGAFGGLALLGFGAPTAPERPSLSAPWHFLREQWRRGLVFKIWLVAIALGLMALAVFGALAYLIPAQLQLSTLAAKWVRRLLFVPFAIPIAVGAGQLVLFGCGKLGGARLLPMLLAGACVGVYASQVFLPALSEHFSPREIYEGYNSLAGPGEMLGEYRVGGRASGYYAKGRVVELTSVNALVDHLRGSGRRWAAFPAEELASIDRAYRKRGGQHVFVADARSARVLLATNQPVPGRANQNLLSGHVLKAPPDKIQHRIEASFDDRIQLLGYDLVTAHNGYVGGGESFKIIWYFRVLQSVPVDYRIFVHIDGEGQRIHGDHDPVEGKYPVRLWDQGDVIVDQQELEVPASDRHGDYAILMGFYSGDARLPVKSGPNDGENRVRVGVLRIQ
jgi:hypothetical protein